MPYTFDWVAKDVVKKLQGKDLRPVKHLSDATKFRQFDILQKRPQSLFWKSEDTPVGYSLLQILEPNFPVPETEVSTPIPLKHTVSQKLKTNVDVKAIAEGSASAEFVQSCGYDIEVQSTSIPESKLESLQNMKLLDQEPSFVKDCRMGRKNLYVVTEAFVVTKGTVLEDSSSVDFSGKVLIPQYIKGQAQGQWQKKSTDSVPILKGSVLAYKKKQLVIENNTCAILLSANAKKKTFLEMLNMQPRSGIFAQPMRMQGEDVLYSARIEIEPYPTRRLGLWTNDISPIGRIEEPYHQDFNRLQDEVSLQIEQLALLSKDVQDVVFSSLLPLLRNREVLHDLMNMLELDQLGHMDGPGGAILDELRKDASPPWIDLKNLILYLLQALMARLRVITLHVPQVECEVENVSSHESPHTFLVKVLSDTQLDLLAQSMEKRLLLQQRELVRSILQPNFKYPWNIPFTLQPQLLAPLQGEGLAITYELLKECGLKMDLNNPRSTWDLEAKMPLSALYGSLSFLQQLVEA